MTTKDPEPTKETADAVRRANAVIRRSEVLVRAAELQIQVAAEWKARAAAFVERMRGAVTPALTDAERDDLVRRLFERVAISRPVTDEVIADAARGNAILAKAVSTLNATPVVHPEGIDDVVIDATEANAAAREVQHAYHWPHVLEEWRLARRPASLARVPAQLMMGKGAPLGLFGHTGSSAKGASRMRDGGRVEALVVSRDPHVRLELGIPEAEQKEMALVSRVNLGARPTPDEVINGVAKVLGNREVRLLVSCFQAAHEDFEGRDATVEGVFWYGQKRFADLLGISTKKSARGCDDSLRALMNVRVDATVKRAGKPHRLQVDWLVGDAGASMEGPRAEELTGGRRPMRAMMLNAQLLGLLDGSYWFPITRAMLAAPAGVDPRTYDDAFRLFLVLASHARTNASKARGPGSAWMLLTPTVLQAAGLQAPSARRHEQIKRLEVLLGVLRNKGDVVADLTGEELRFDLPTLRPSFMQVLGRSRPDGVLTSGKK